jgi:hypothetical protein
MAPQSDTSSLHVLVCSSMTGGLGRDVDRRRALFCSADGCLGGHLHVEPVSEQACSLSLSWFGHNVASDFDRDDWLLTLLSSGCAHAFKPETYCANPDRAHRNDSHGVFGYGATSTANEFLGAAPGPPSWGRFLLGPCGLAATAGL